MPSDLPSIRLSPDEVGEVLRRSGVTGARVEDRPTVEELAEQAVIPADRVREIVESLRSLGAAIDIPSGDLEQIRLSAQELEDVEEDPRALARVAEDYAGVRMEGGAGKLPKSTRLVLILAAVIFLALVLAKVTMAPPTP